MYAKVVYTFSASDESTLAAANLRAVFSETERAGRPGTTSRASHINNVNWETCGSCVTETRSRTQLLTNQKALEYLHNCQFSPTF